MGAISFSAKFRTIFLNICCSSFRSKSSGMVSSRRRVQGVKGSRVFSFLLDYQAFLNLNVILLNPWTLESLNPKICLCFIGYPVIIKYTLGWSLRPEFSLHLHPDIGFPYKQ